PLDKHQLKHCRQVIARAKRLKDALLFLQPVDPVKLGIPTYFHFVKRPMDLSTIQKKLDTGVYRVATECVDDLLLMIQNCWLFNGKESAVGGIATNLWRYFEKELVAKMPQHLEVKRPSSSASHGHYAAPAPIERPKRDVQPPPRINSMDLQGVSPTRKPFSKQALSDLKFAAQLVRELMKPKYYTFAYPFLTPVDWVALQIPTYPHIIKHPMDFGTILKRLDQGHYTNGSEFEADSRLVFRNCYTFNAVGSDVYEMGRKLEQVFDLKWRERPIDLNKMQENLLKLMQEVTKLAAHKGTKKKDKHKKHKMHALLQQQALTAAIAGAASSSSLLSSHPSLSTTSSSAPSKKKKKSSSSSHRSSRPPAAPAVRDISYQQKKELSEKIELLSPDKLEGVYQIIRNGMPSLDSVSGQDEIELDIDSLDKVTLSRLYHFVINAATGRPVTSAPPPVSAPKSLSTANGNASSSDSDDSGSDSDSGSD
ncbi:Bromodomain-containing protein, partial [Rhizoclosmatium globosum]